MSILAKETIKEFAAKLVRAEDEVLGFLFTPVFDTKAGDSVNASFDCLGTVSAVVVE